MTDEITPGPLPNAGDWVLFRLASSYHKVAVEMKQAERVTPRLVKFVGAHYPRQCGILEVVASFSDKATAERVRDAIGGIAGEYERRRRSAHDELSARLTAAITAANQQVRRAIASAAGAGTAETRSVSQGEARQSGAQSADAQTPSPITPNGA